MDIKKLVPWNWFKKEEEDSGRMVPVRRESPTHAIFGLDSPLGHFHREIDRLFERMFQEFGLAPFGRDLPGARMLDGALRPTLDVGATEKEYSITVEIPGVDEKDLKLEIVNDTLTIQGEKKQEKEESERDYYRIERAYGAFRRVLSLPEDADQANVKATFKKGVLTITLPRKAQPRASVRQIEVKSA